MTHHLAEVNVARLLAPADDPLIADFVVQLDRINALAEASPGFVWRYVSDTRDPGDREYEDPLMLFNLSVWQSPEHLYDYAYKSDHAKVFADRKRWFGKIATPSMAMWWIPIGHTPTVDEAQARLEWLHLHGPSPRAFTFRLRFDAQGNRIEGKKPEAASAQAGVNAGAQPDATADALPGAQPAVHFKAVL